MVICSGGVAILLLLKGFHKSSAGFPPLPTTINLHKYVLHFFIYWTFHLGPVTYFNFSHISILMTWKRIYPKCHQKIKVFISVIEEIVFYWRSKFNIFVYTSAIWDQSKFKICTKWFYIPYHVGIKAVWLT